MVNIHFVSALNRKIRWLKWLVTKPTNRWIIPEHYANYIEHSLFKEVGAKGFAWSLFSHSNP
jgi:hypothetical protein